jgi:hypothetical protein
MEVPHDTYRYASRSRSPLPPGHGGLLLLLLIAIEPQSLNTSHSRRTSAALTQGIVMSEGYTIDADDETAGIVVRYAGERGFRFHSASRTFDALDGHVFVTPAAAERAAREFVHARAARAALRGGVR